PPGPDGPYPSPFDATNAPEAFSSDGPVRLYYRPDGTPITPGDLTATGGTVVDKPDLLAADDVSTSVPGFAPFLGTSASAPRAARAQIGYHGPKPTAGQTVVLQVTGAGSDPVPADASAVALNVTGTGAEQAGFVTVWPCDAPRPLASNLNLAPDDTRANLVV